MLGFRSGPFGPVLPSHAAASYHSIITSTSPALQSVCKQSQKGLHLHPSGPWPIRAAKGIQW